ncbi:hypothetical protein GCM10008992_03850 [Halorubrum aquaticum]
MLSSLTFIAGFFVCYHVMKRSGEYVVVRARNDHDAMTVLEPSRNRTFHVVECGGDELARVLDEVERGDPVRLELRRTGRRGNAWRVESADTVTEGEDANSVVGRR